MSHKSRPIQNSQRIPIPFEFLVVHLFLSSLKIEPWLLNLLRKKSSISHFLTIRLYFDAVFAGVVNEGHSLRQSLYGNGGYTNKSNKNRC